jgi:hypothetical protein
MRRELIRQAAKLLKRKKRKRKRSLSYLLGWPSHCNYRYREVMHLV